MKFSHYGGSEKADVILPRQEKFMEKGNMSEFRLVINDLRVDLNFTVIKLFA